MATDDRKEAGEVQEFGLEFPTTHPQKLRMLLITTGTRRTTTEYRGLDVNLNILTDDKFSVGFEPCVHPVHFRST